MEKIPTSSCHKCQPKKWKVIKPSVGAYKCLNCENKFESVLKKK